MATEDVYITALKSFDDIQAAQRDERQQCMDDRRFCSIAGAQWEGALGAQFENKPRLEVNKIQLSVIRIYNEYRNNRITVNFEPTDGSKADTLSDTCNDLYRATEHTSVAEEAYDNAFDEGTMGGIGAWRLRNDYIDEYNPDNEQQHILIEPIYDADKSVYFNLDAKRQDKADATECFVITSMTKAAYKEQWDDDPVSWPKEDYTTGYFDWAVDDNVYVAEYYKIEEGKDKIFTYASPLGMEETVFESEIDEDDTIIPDLTAQGYRKIKERKIKTRQCHKYILSGGGILEDIGIIAGKNIPIVPFFGKRWYVDSIERAMGHTRLPKDMQRVNNMLVSSLGEMAGTSAAAKPIVTPEQIAGHEAQWRDDNVNNYPYLLLNPLQDKDGNEHPVAPPYTRPTEVPPTLAALLQVANADIKELLGNPEAGEKIASNISEDAIELVHDRLDMQTFIYMSNMAKAIKRSGTIWLSMAKDIYTKKGHKLKGVTSQGTTRQIILKKEILDPDTKEVIVENDFSKANMDISVEVGPSSSTKRKSIVKSLTKMLPLIQDPETANVMISLVLMNMEGEGLSDVREYFRDKLVRQGVVQPNEEEQKLLAAEAQNQQPSPQDIYLQQSAEKEAALAQKAQADTELSIAKTGQAKADTAETLAGIERADTAQLIETVELLNQ